MEETMRKTLAFCFAVIGWFAIVAQYVLMLENRVTPVGEATIRFFSFFTVLTNIWVALYFSFQVFRTKHQKSIIHRPGILTALTGYITVVGLGYQLLLRHLWNPTGLQWLVDELLHSVIPILVILYWYLYERITSVRMGRIASWLLYPLVYLIYVLIRGSYSGFYPYPFVDVAHLGLTQVLINSLLFALVFVVIFWVFIGLGKKIQR